MGPVIRITKGGIKYRPEFEQCVSVYVSWGKVVAKYQYSEKDEIGNGPVREEDSKNNRIRGNRSAIWR